MIRMWIVSLMVLCVAATAQAAKIPGVGDKITAVFSAVNVAGEPVDYDDIKGKKGTVIVFVRSADWCGYCKEQLRDWSDNGTPLVDAGYNVVSVSYDSPETLMKFKNEAGISYTMLSDESAAMVKGLGILNENFEEGSRFYGIPNPSIYVVDAAGVIKHKFAEEDYKDRPEIALIAGKLGVEIPKALE